MPTRSVLVGAVVLALIFAGVASVYGSALAISGIHIYQKTLSPLGERIGIGCRFTPTCSRYAEVVIVRDGIVRGGWKAMRRIARCGPWTPVGMWDQP